jgi:hypothetical protein
MLAQRVEQGRAAVQMHPLTQRQVNIGAGDTPVSH